MRLERVDRAQEMRASMMDKMHRNVDYWCFFMVKLIQIFEGRSLFYATVIYNIS